MRGGSHAQAEPNGMAYRTLSDGESLAIDETRQEIVG